MAVAAILNLRKLLLFHYKLTKSHKSLALVATRRDWTKNMSISSENWKFKMAAVAIFELHKLQYVSYLWTDFVETWRAEADWYALRNINFTFNLYPNSRRPLAAEIAMTSFRPQNKRPKLANGTR